MRAQLIFVYVLLGSVCAMEPFKQLDFMFTLFFSASCCLVYAMTAKEIDDIFAELFIIFQAVALVDYGAMAVSYSWLDAAYMSLLNDINTALLITDIICLVGVALGDRRVFNWFS